MHKKTIITGAIILTGANIITRLLGFFYRIYMTKLMGAEGMGVYQLISPLYLLVWAISASGLSTAVSKLTAQEKAKGNIANAHRILLYALTISTTIAFMLSIFIYNNSISISVKVLNDIRTAASLRLLSYCFPCMAAGSVIRGYFLGLQTPKIPAASQVIEQCVRIGAVYIMADSMMYRGIEYTCCAAVIGMAAGEIISFAYTGICYLYAIGKIKTSIYPSVSRSAALTMLLAAAIPLTLNRICGSLFSAAENILIPQRLQVYGYTQSQALSTYGRLCGMAMPLVMFPSSLLNALSTALLPAISEGNALNQKRILYSAIHKSLMVTGIIAIGTSAVFVTYSYDVGYIIYKNNIGIMLKILGIMCPLLYLQVIFSGMLNGFGEQLFIFKINLMSAIINIAFIYILIPIFGIYAFMAGWFLSSIIVTVLSAYKIKKHAGKKLYLLKLFIIPVLSATASALISLLIKNAISGMGSSLFSSLTCISAMCVMYVVFLYVSGYIQSIKL